MCLRSRRARERAAAGQRGPSWRRGPQQSCRPPSSAGHIRDSHCGRPARLPHRFTPDTNALFSSMQGGPPPALSVSCIAGRVLFGGQRRDVAVKHQAAGHPIHWDPDGSARAGALTRPRIRSARCPKDAFSSTSLRTSALQIYKQTRMKPGHQLSLLYARVRVAGFAYQTSSLPGEINRLFSLFFF